MAENGAALQSYNNELVKCIEDLCSKRDDVSREIKMDEQEKEKLEHDIAILHERLQKVVTNLARKTQIRDEYGNFINPRTNIFLSWSSYSKSRVPIFIGSENFISALQRLLKRGASFRLSFGPNSVWDSIETTIVKTHPTLVRRTSIDLLFRANYCRNRGRLFEDFGDISHVAEQCQNAND